jgi:hypothetical protein
MMMSEIASIAMEPFWSAEMDYRRERAQRDWGDWGSRGRRRLRIRRRPTLKLPRPSPRPVAVA